MILTKDNDILIILSPGFPANERDTTCLPAQQNFVKALNESFPEIKIIILAFDYPFSKEEYHWFGSKVIPFNGYARRKFSRVLLWRTIWKKMKRLEKENHVIGLLSFWCSDCALLAKKFGKKYSLKHYCWIMGQDAKKGNKYVKLIKPQSSELIALSDFLAEEFYRNYKTRPAQIIPNAVDPRLFSSPPIKKDIDILGAGSLIPLKRYDIFISVIDELKKQIPSITTVICGKGEEENNLRELIKRGGLEKNISMVGERPYHEVLKFMQRSVILLHPSSYEGCSGACLEALAAGAHVVSFTRAMNDEIDHWHIVNTQEEMTSQVSELLMTKTTKHVPVLPFKINDCAKQIMKLFGKGMS